jgi:hypothetical protein
MVFYEPEVLAAAGPLQFGTRPCGSVVRQALRARTRDDQPVSAYAGRSPAA